MRTGMRIKRLRRYRGLTQKALGITAGLDASSAGIRIAQYESGARKPGAAMLHKLAMALDVSRHALSDPVHGDEIELLHLLFYLEDTVGVNLHDVAVISDDIPGSHTAISVRWKALASLLQEWRRLRDTMTRQEYMEWRLHWSEV